MFRFGNTLIVVEHDEDTMRAADYIVDIGPKAGVHGGKILQPLKLTVLAAKLSGTVQLVCKIRIYNLVYKA